MQRLIDANALLQVPNVRKVTEYDESGEFITYLAIPVEAIKNAPTIDAVPVVRCCQCKHVTRDLITGNFLCARNRKVKGNIVYGGFLVDKYDYCSFGVKINLEGCP